MPSRFAFWEETMDLLTEIAERELVEKKLEQPIEVEVHRSKPGDFRVGTGNTPASGMFRISVRNGYPIRAELKKLGFRFQGGEWSKTRIRAAEPAMPSAKFRAMMKRQPSEGEMEAAVKRVDELAKKVNADISARNRQALGAGEKKSKLPEPGSPGRFKALGKWADRVKRTGERWKKYGVEVKYDGRGASMRIIFAGKGTFPLRDLFKKNGFRWVQGTGWTMPSDAWDAIEDRFTAQAFKALPKAKGGKKKPTEADIMARLTTYKRMKADPEAWMVMREKYPWLEGKDSSELSDEEWEAFMSEAVGLEEATGKFTVQVANGMIKSTLYRGKFDSEDKARAYAQKEAKRSQPFMTYTVYTGMPRNPGSAVGKPIKGGGNAKKGKGVAEGRMTEGTLLEAALGVSRSRLSPDAPDELLALARGAGLPVGTHGPAGRHRASLGAPNLEVELRTQAMKAMDGGRELLSEGQSTAPLAESAPPDPLSWIMGRDLQQDIYRNQESGYVPSAAVLGTREQNRQKDQIDSIGRKLFGYQYASERDGDKSVWVSYRDNRNMRERDVHMKGLAKELKKVGYRVKTTPYKGDKSLIDTMYVLYDTGRIKKARAGHKKYLDAMRKGGATRMDESVELALESLIPKPQVLPGASDLMEGVQPVLDEARAELDLKVRSYATGRGWVSVSGMAKDKDFRGIHYANIEKAVKRVLADEKKKGGKVETKTDAQQGDMFKLLPPSHRSKKEAVEEGKRKSDYSRGAGGRSSELSWKSGPKPGKAQKKAASRGERRGKGKHISAQMRGEDLATAAVDALLGEAKGGGARDKVKRFSITKGWGGGFAVKLDDQDDTKLKKDKEVQGLLSRRFTYPDQAQTAGQSMFRNATVAGGF